MQTKFTPGPWTAHSNGDGTNISVSSNGKSFIAVWDHSLDGTVFPSEANAALVAAAPDMYLALSYALAALKELNILEATQELIIEAQRKALGA